MARQISIGLVGAGMFGGDVHLRTFIQLEKSGISPWLGRLGLDPDAYHFRDIEFHLVALATHTRESAERVQAACAEQDIQLDIFYGETPWVDLLKAYPTLDILAVATPDHLHTAPVLAALEKGTHVIVEKPMALTADDADKIVDASRRTGLLVGVDMHKRYDPDHLCIRDYVTGQIGTPLYGTAILEEPLEIPVQVFRKWAEQSDPFSYVGCHWTDLFIAYFGVKPSSLHAVGQKVRLRNDFGIDTFDAVQVKVTFNNGMSIDFVNSWILPDGFEGPVNQESRIFGTHGLVESDSQYRGLRFTSETKGTRTRNTHFTRDVLREDGSYAYVGYGVDSLVVCVEKVAEMKYLGHSLNDIQGTYPDAEQGRLSALIVYAAREVCRRNHAYIEAGQGAPVTAVFNQKGIQIFDPYEGPSCIYDRPV